MRELRGVSDGVREEGADAASLCIRLARFAVFIPSEPLGSTFLQLPPNRQFTEILDCSDACAVTNCKEVPPPARKRNPCVFASD